VSAGFCRLFQRRKRGSPRTLVVLGVLTKPESKDLLFCALLVYTYTGFANFQHSAGDWVETVAQTRLYMSHTRFYATFFPCEYCNTPLASTGVYTGWKSNRLLSQCPTYHGFWDSGRT
jgi:hypothetical protein